ncbi:Mitochondrial carnitine-acylcarnitine carrier protein [Dioscorea alata]|uniref:Mitochondrial carnitine-acylcarnitine carrier protein n=1 Tax=Dioscorea alata TaxID=55571 RepID=A0ACB7UH61_DIOAL|nr:Mitochondrial carnitine-acylcarnitine carrier protein [Dioscorea alata]
MAAGDAAKDYAAGFVAGVATVIVGHPFDTVKVKLQAYNTKTQVKEYKNAWQCTGRILRTEGGDTQSSQPQLQVIIPSAAYGGAIISMILCPAELVKCRMQVQGTESSVSKYARYSGPLDCALKTIRSEGLKGIFRGGYTTLLRESTGNATFFTIYEFSRYQMRKRLDSSSSTLGQKPKMLIEAGVDIIGGGLAGMSFWLAVLPLDVAKTIIQTSPDTNSSWNPFQTLKSIYRRVGFRGLYASLGPTLARAFPANATAMVTWELTAKLLGVQRH